ncbi:TonB-dependent receptor plug domain-containing protein [Ferruginibacter sp. SUN106]|uniref:TonB-dependent receptor plug domain-containing protein n=1 Tax=Ferruginibacter sp. SUN106 TaxID=2978348 RepID=UPI003D36CE07
MQKRNVYHSILVLLSLIFSYAVNAQDYAATKEKIYIQTNHVFYKPGDVVYFKLYLVKAQDQTPSYQSSVVYVELISPAGTVAQKSTFKVTNGYAEGSFDFSELAVGGIYKIRAYTSWMMNENENHFFVKEITLQKVLAPRVLLKLDFPEKGYGAGSAVKANFSMRSIANEPIRNYQGKYTVSVGGEAISTQTFKTNNEGKAVINFSLPGNLATTDGLLNVTIDYDAYTEAISRSIPIVLNTIDLQFMPEGGTLVNGISNYIAFKALNENGKAADIKGYVTDSKGNTVTTFESYHFGMGKFLFTPQTGQVYKAVITSPSNIAQQFDLPVASANGVVMQVRKANKKITVLLNTATDMEVILKASTKSVNYHTQTIFLLKGENEIRIDENIFPAGIAQFTLYKTNELPLAERLVFLNEDKQLSVTITTDKQKYLPREKVLLTIKTVDEKGIAVPANFSLAVVDDKLWTFADDKQDHILSWLLLSSELKGKIEEPQFYFKKDEPKAVAALDLLMLTQGYRYFDYIEYVQNERKLKYLPDQYNILSGKIVNTANQPVQAKMFLINTVPGGKAIKIQTDKEGMFFFSELEPQKNYYLFAQSFDKKEKINIQVLQNGVGYNPTQTKDFKQLLSKPLDFGALAPFTPALVKNENKKQEEANVALPMPNKNMALNEVVVTGYGTQRRKDITGSVQVVQAKELNNFNDWSMALQGKVAGVQIRGNANPGGDLKIVLRGMAAVNNNTPLFVVNGIPMEQLNLNTINTSDIESVTVLKDASATALYGARAANGVIIVDLKKFRYERMGIKFTKSYYYTSQQVYTTGTAYAAARKFYAPKYTSTATSNRTDFRETIYWNPVVQTDNDGKAAVEFYNSDASTTFRAITEGIGYNGKLGRAEATYAVQNALQVDAKIPPYLTVGDKALIPLVIKNNSAENMQLNISVMFPANFKNSSYTNTVTIKQDSALQLLIPAEATGAVKGVVQFIVTGANDNESISLPVVATEKGFPVIATFSGNKAAQHNFVINKMIPGSLKANLKLLKNIEGQLLDGIESMLREPYGCFEQTSSSTYPNIYILKYLKESGKSNPAIEQKALDYIERGYKRLIGFETSVHGFEWFGHTPPHEALTAYGLMEFTDMQEFIDVDKKMLERTKQFLLSRRDGNGSFNIQNHGYDQFASVPNKIANTYIVYALTQAGIGKEIQKEYEKAVQKALESKDGYQLAMMAIAAQNMKDAVAFNQLMDELNKQYEKVNFNAETSVVNSRDASLRVETCALYAIALMKAPSPQLGRVSDLISRILGEKSYYGYGSTQSTVLALKAIVEYSKFLGHINEDVPVNFTLNSKTVTVDKPITENVQEGNNNFTVNYTEKDKTVPYNLEVAYNTFTPPNSAKAELQLRTSLNTTETKVGETVRMQIAVTNTRAALQPMAIAKIGIPAGLAAQPWQLKELMEKNQAAYYEIFDNYLVFYWMGFAPNETKTINLDLKAEVPGTYKGKSGNTYLYYTPEYKHWNDGVEITIKE